MVLNYDTEGKAFAPESVTIRREAFPEVYQIIRAVEERATDESVQAPKRRSESS